MHKWALPYSCWGFHSRRVWKYQRRDQPCCQNTNTIKTDPHSPDTSGAPEFWNRVLQKLFLQNQKLPEIKKSWGNCSIRWYLLYVNALPQAAHVCMYFPGHVHTHQKKRKEKGREKRGEKANSTMKSVSLTDLQENLEKRQPNELYGGHCRPQIVASKTTLV